MPADPAAGFPIDALTEALATVGVGGELQARNQRMADWLATAREDGQPVRTIDQLPVDATNRGLLLSGAVVAWGGRQQAGEMQLVGTSAGQWLVVREAVAVGPTLAAARVRSLGAMAGALVHDLANLLGAGVGIAELLRGRVVDRGEQQMLDELLNGARQGALLGRALARSLGRKPRRMERVMLGLVVEDAMALVEKTAQRQGVVLDRHGEVDGLEIRAVPEEAVQAVVHAALAGLDGGASRLTVVIEAGNRSFGGGRTRRAAVVRLSATPCAAAVSTAVTRALAMARTGVDESPGAAERITGFGCAAFAIAVAGGEATATTANGGLTIEFAWPAVGP